MTDGRRFRSIVALPRAERVAELAASFPDLVDLRANPAGPAAVPLGGRRAALESLATLDPVAYGRTRNRVGGAVTGLSPWIRHGVLSLAEVRDAALARAGSPEHAEKFVSQLAWRDYWRRVHAELGDHILSDIEAPAAIPRRADRLDSVPDDVLTASTGMECIDAFVRKLHDTGRLHNHERLWLASWLIHVRGVRWRAGADWFLRHLLDGDPASNHLSWQWVAGTFAAKPYLFNRENLQTFSGDAHCGQCPLLGRCDVEGDYAALAMRLFSSSPPERPSLRIRPTPPHRQHPNRIPARPLVWLTLDSVAATSPAATAHPASPALFVIDPAWLEAERPSLARLVFLFDCRADVPGVAIEVGDPCEVVLRMARVAGCDGIAVAETPCPRVRKALESLGSQTAVVVSEWPQFCDPESINDLGRFSRYWSRVRASALRPTRMPGA